MSARARELADRFDQARGEVIAALEGYSDAQLSAFCPPEQCTVVALACHVAEAHPLVIGWVRAVVTGEPLPDLTMAQIDERNAELAARYERASREEALALLRRYGDTASEYVRGLSDEDLRRSAPFSLLGGAEVTAEGLIERVLIGDPQKHLPSIKAAAEQAATESARA